jgi:hypothetical protein
LVFGVLKVIVITAMRFEERIQRRSRVAALVAFAIWCGVFAGLVVSNVLLGKNPTPRWITPCGPLLLIMSADQIICSEWHAKQGYSINHDPKHHILTGIFGLVTGIGITAAALILRWWSLPWFE